MTRETIAVDGCATSYVRGGKGPTLLYLHGSGGIRGDEAYLARLAEHYDVVAPDHPGFGRSDVPPWLDEIDDLGYFYLDFIAALGLRDLHLVGHSLGGWIACALAVRSVADLASLVLVAPAGLRVKGLRKADTFLMSPEARAARSYHDPALARAILAAAVDDAELERQLKNRYAFALLAWQPRLYDPNLEKWLHRVRIPTLVLWGDDDRIIPPAYADAFAARIPDAKVELLEGCGHVPQVERLDAFVDRVVAFTGSRLAGASR